MKNCTFYRPEKGFPMDDLQTNIIEILLNLNTELGGKEKANEIMFRMFELAFPNATEEELQEFTKIQGSWRCLNEVIDENQTHFQDLVLEQESYKNLYYGKS